MSYEINDHHIIITVMKTNPNTTFFFVYGFPYSKSPEDRSTRLYTNVLNKPTHSSSGHEPNCQQMSRLSNNIKTNVYK